MFDYSILAIDVDNLLLTPSVTLKEARDLLVFIAIQKRAETQKIFPETAKDLKTKIGTRIELAINKDEFFFQILDADKFEFFHNGQMTYDFNQAEVNWRDLFSWARGTNIFIPDHIYKKICLPTLSEEVEPILESAEEEYPEELSGNEKQELGRLRGEAAKWKEAIIAAVKAGWHYSKFNDGEIITRPILVDYLHAEGHKTLPTTTIDKIWKSLPKSIKSTGGRPKGSKDVH